MVLKLNLFMIILSLLIKINLKKNYLLHFQKILFITIFFYSFINEILLANDAKNQLKEIEKELEQNEKIQNILKIKQKKINTSIKEIESVLKKNEKKIKNYFSDQKLISLEINKSKKNKEEIQNKLTLLTNNKKNIIYSFIKENHESIKNLADNESKEANAILVNIYKSILVKIDLNNKRLTETNMLINSQEERLAKLKNKLKNTNKKLLESSDLETTLQGENLITLIQKKEKELEGIEISQKAKELKKLLEKLKKKSKKLSRKKVTQEYNLKKIENILPINLKNIEKIRTDSSKKGILLTLKEKSFLTTPLDGLVVYADSFKGYGNMIILDLGNNYHIIYSGLTNIMCSVGDWLNTGNILGEIEMKDKINEVYLEVRFKGKTLDPSSWLKS